MSREQERRGHRPGANQFIHLMIGSPNIFGAVTDRRAPCKAPSWWSTSLSEAFFSRLMDKALPL